MKLLFLFSFFFFSYCAYSQEICNNGKDDDGNGLIDLKDPGCQCNVRANNNLLLNPSFESFKHCPISYFYHDEHDIIVNWEHAAYPSGGISHYHNLSCKDDSARVMNYHPLQLPLPDGKGFVFIKRFASNQHPENKIYKDYVSQCLQSPLIKGEKYTLTFFSSSFKLKNDNNFNPHPYAVAAFGHKSCSSVPFGQSGTGNGCPANHAGWVFLGKVVMQPSLQWAQGKIALSIPEDVNLIAIGPDCTMPDIGVMNGNNGVDDDYNFYLDDLQLLPTKDFNFKYVEAQSGSACAGNYILVAPVQSGAAYQWYKDSIAIAGATATTYSVPDSITKAVYNVRITTPGGCQTTEPFALQRSALYQLQLPADTFFCSSDTLLLAPRIKGVSYSWNGRTDTVVRLSQAGRYNITATDSFGCKRRFSVKADKQDCKNCIILLPSAFTPNGDGINDVLKAYINCGVSSFNLQIYNRWGQRLFESSDLSQGWDGTYRKVKVPPGAYIYVVRYKTSSSTSNYKVSTGTVTVLY